ncbi:outer membrane protein OmpA-like peptidoglycan-associated protein [Chitinophaga niastensis]|uniref:Outer membrane protein OmpA-like peptidoglycan-associated protein n=1 Tax=Chitinophaga niastensis TaxID=536980 RepID=A0A2P8HQ54_CHINA|nr:OmpA family protein [Chitinophaga niastensis]PSL48348.1 outer membrane protein OmpA-like peptidoglycan-associated protein [Chitinophaga niastensis]
MKKLVLVLVVCALGGSVRAQLFDRIKNKVQQKVNDAVDKTIDKATEAKKKDTPASGNVPDVKATTENGAVNTTANGNAGTTVNTNITSYSRFDFVPGEKIIVEESFSQDPIGEFPGQWNTHSGAELVTVSNRPGKWLRIQQDGVFFPEYINSNFPDNFTLQVDVMANNEISNIGSLAISLIKADNTEEKFNYGTAASTTTPSFKVELTPRSSGSGVFRYSSNLIEEHSISDIAAFNVPKKNFVKVSIWRQKQRVRVYLDDNKILDLPRALDPNTILNTLAFHTYAPTFDSPDGAFFISNIRLAVGAPDTRNKLITEGKFVTHGILFNTNSDEIQAESYGALKDIAAVLTDNPALRVKIVGHTDTDGNEQLNLDLSKRRAEAVKTALNKTFNIDLTRMETNGKGKTQPIDNNTTDVGKANNRRVEFVKI